MYNHSAISVSSINLSAAIPSEITGDDETFVQHCVITVDFAGPSSVIFSMDHSQFFCSIAEHFTVLADTQSGAALCFSDDEENDCISLSESISDVLETSLETAFILFQISMTFRHLISSGSV